jgi:hypothetical protein
VLWRNAKSPAFTGYSLNCNILIVSQVSGKTCLALKAADNADYEAATIPTGREIMFFRL